MFKVNNLKIRARTQQPPWDSDEVIRAVVFGRERLIQHGRSLAENQPISLRAPLARTLHSRLAENEEVLLQAHKKISQAISDGRSVTPAAEWLVNNSHVIEPLVRSFKINLPLAFYKQLPKLAEGPLAGYPRIVGIAWAFVAHTDSRFDAALLKSFVAAYQEISELRVGELWALPMTIQLVLIENLRRAAERIITGRDERHNADAVADKISASATHAIDSIPEAKLFAADGTVRAAFVAQLAFRFNDWDQHHPQQWLASSLSARNLRLSDVLDHEHRRVAAMNETVRNAIRSLQLIPEVRWQEFVESVSLVDAVLSQVPPYADMDFATRNSYRTAIERLARRSKLSETEIARAAVELSQETQTQSQLRDPGFFLIGAGAPALQRRIGHKHKFSDLPGLLTKRGGLPGYLATLAVLTALLLALPLLAMQGLGTPTIWMVALALTGLLPTLELASTIVSQAIARELYPLVIPGMELRDGVPATARTLVVIPTMLSSATDVAEMAGRLETHHLSTLSDNVFYAIASDYLDALEPTGPSDAAVLAAALDGIEKLNRAYPTARGADARFYVFHRRRLLNAADGVWMGWERKRGKLHELNGLLRGRQDTTYLPNSSSGVACPGDIKYVITLDSDTRLPREAARKLIGKMQHPINAPVFCDVTQRITSGYGILQPRVTPSLPQGDSASAFQQLNSLGGGVDPYASAASDTYQDLFGEGSFTGKGIYDIDAFMAATRGRFPDNTVLSHDLIEGVYARAGLASDVEVVEEFPARYDVARSREHRWIRGDWQLLPWIYWGAARSAESSKPASAMPALARWKLVNNLLRSLTPVAQVAALLVGWLAAPHSATLWTLFIIFATAFPYFQPLLSRLGARELETTFSSHAWALLEEAKVASAQAVFACIVMCDRASLALDAIVRSVTRIGFTRKNLLEWTTAAQAKSLAARSAGAYYTRMRLGVALAVAIFLIIAAFAPDSLALATPLVILWIAAPEIARRTSLDPVAQPIERLMPSDERQLRAIGLRTWKYFETFVGPDDHFLPPDNFQEDPTARIAPRTSPTNIGLYLLSIVSAREMGWITSTIAADRIEQTLRTISKLPKYQGHLFNWYDTRTLSVLSPPYVSSVDSGNMAGHLIALAGACRRWVGDERVVREGALDFCFEFEAGLPAGFDDRYVIDALAQLRANLAAADMDWRAVQATAARLQARLTETSLAPAREWAQRIGNLAQDFIAEEADAPGATLMLSRRLEALAATADYLTAPMEFSFLVDPERELLSIGYSVDAQRLDDSCYDLLASEARLASLIAIARGDLPARHWFKLGRTILPVRGIGVLGSWSGSMFEYLMPELVTLTPDESLVGRTLRAAIKIQISHGAKRGTPWGVSESAYSARDLEFTYQYSPFGVPELGFKRGLDEKHVVAPYASALATMVFPESATANFRRLIEAGALGTYGFYEAIDYSKRRDEDAPAGEIIKAYMAHHQGMTVCAIANAVCSRVLAHDFHSSPFVQSVELLLQERPPRLLPKPTKRATLLKLRKEDEDASPAAVRRITVDNLRRSDCQVLSNGRLGVLVNGTGSGQITWNGLAVTRWSADSALDLQGSHFYLRDRSTGHVWSAGLRPTDTRPDRYEAAFSEDRVRLSRVDQSIRSVLDILVDPEADAVCRRVSITNTGRQSRTIDITSYDELAMATPSADAAHKAFAKLFIETECDRNRSVIFAHRRKRSPDDADIRVAAFVAGPSGFDSFETDRGRFIGRSRTPASPAAVISGRPLSETSGYVIDPAIALRKQIVVGPGETVRVAFWLAVAATREEILDIVAKHRDGDSYGRAATLAWTKSMVELRHLGIDPDEALALQQIAGCVLHSAKDYRAPEITMRRGAHGLGAIWRAGISGDLPIILVYIDDVADVGVIRQLLHGFEYWRSKNLEFDLVIINDRGSSYQQELHQTLTILCETASTAHRLHHKHSRASVYLLRADLISEDTREALPALARVVFYARRGLLTEQIDRVKRPSAFKRIDAPKLPDETPTPVLPAEDLEFANGLGGFRNNGSEYVVVLRPGQSTPAPWANVIANADFGFIVSAEGATSTWSVNSKERQITPWSNDPVSNATGEALYIRDDDSGDVWSPTASAIRKPEATYTAAHGQGYSRFELTWRGIRSTLDQFVANDQPVKFSRLRVVNNGSKPRRLTLTAYAEWTLGVSRSSTAAGIQTRYDAERSSIFARNPWHQFFSHRVAFLALSGAIRSATGDRHHFFGQHGGLDRPTAVLSGERLEPLFGTGFDPCAALQTSVTLAPGQEREFLVILGDAANDAEAARLADRYLRVSSAELLRAATEKWNAIVASIEIETPDRAMDILVNRWLPYQSLSSRIWGRAGLYQAGGAYGFRDQLQDVLSLLHTRPDLARSHILRAASRQFPEGDVQHWWLDPSGHGIRTRIADSCLWLPYVACEYAAVTGDAAVLDVETAFVDGPLLNAHEHDVYFAPRIAEESASLYEHCVRSIDRSLTAGAHGLALFGGGDWNDGMNRVGIEGKGESVWLSWFLIVCITRLLPHATRRGDDARAARWREHVASLTAALDQDGWDGEWYRRGYYDNGDPLGSKVSDECRIDSIAQAWSVFAGTGDPQRQRVAMASVKQHLIDREAGLAMLFTPPFDRTENDPGYIKGYPPGVRENGGQYTHAAIWSAMALAELGDGDGAAELLALLNPINKTRSGPLARRYRLEPYVIAADVYSIGANKGRGGWSWYTGSAGWYFRACVESLLGIRRSGEQLIISPTIPRHWPGFTATYRTNCAEIRISVDNQAGCSRGIRGYTVSGAPVSDVQINDVAVTIRIPADATAVNLQIFMGESRSQAVAEQIVNAAKPMAEAEADQRTALVSRANDME